MKFSFCLILLLFNGYVHADDAVMDVIPLQNRPAAELVDLLAPMLEKTDKVIADGPNLIVKTTSDRLESILVMINRLDVRVNNLAITVIQNSSKTASELNAETAMLTSPSQIRMHGMNADTRDVNSSQRMQLHTMDGHAAYIKIAKLKQQQQVNVYGSMGYNNSSIGSYSQTQEASSGFAVTPRLTGQEVVLDIEPWSENFQHGVNMDTQAAHTTLRANLGEWIEIAGNATDNQSAVSGMNTFNHSTHKNNFRILIKVDLDGGSLIYPN